MAELRTYVKTSGRKAVASMRRVDAERVRLDWRSDDGTLLASQIVADDEAAGLAADMTAFLAPAPVPEPPAPKPPPPATDLTPAVLTGSVGPGTIGLAWAHDGRGVARWEVWLNDAWQAALPAAARQWSRSGLPAGPVSARVVAYDAAGAYENSNPISVTVAGSTPEPPPSPTAAYRFNTLVFEENFDTLDLTRWSLYNGNGHAGNGVRRPEQWSIQEDVQGATGGCLVGTAEWDAALGKIKAPGMSLRRDWTTFRVECRARVEPDLTDTTAANLPLLWPRVYMDNPYEEVNPYESSGPHNETRGMSSFAHYGAVTATKGAGDQVYFDLKVDGTQWHTVNYERTPESMSCWVDGVHKWTITDPKVLPKREHHPCLQLDAIKNANPGKPIRCYVDFLRVYQ